MSHVKAGGSTKNLRDSNPQYLGIKKSNGQGVKTGQIIVRQRGTKFIPGKNVMLGKDHTIFASRNGVVSFNTKRKTAFTGKEKMRKIVNVI